MEYKIHQYRYNFKPYEEVIRKALNELDYTETDNVGPMGIPGLNIYNHCHSSELTTKNNLIFKPTAPSGDYFAIDKIGYASASQLAFNKPNLPGLLQYKDSDNIIDLIANKSNKWDNSILLKWRKPKNVLNNHILIVGQMPDDESVTRHSFGGHIEKITAIIKELKGEKVLLKLHPRYKPTKKFMAFCEQYDIEVMNGYYSIHDILPYTKVAIIENSTAGIECLMHNVPIISYGWPEYHWATHKLQSLTELKGLVNNLDWYDRLYAKDFINWYINSYLCNDVNSTIRRLKDLGYGPN